MGERGGFPIKEIPALVLDVAREMGWVDNREAESLRSALSAAREEANDADRVRALLGEILDALCGVLKPNTPPGVLPSYADLPDLARAAREEARRAVEQRDEIKEKAQGAARYVLDVDASNRALLGRAEKAEALVWETMKERDGARIEAAGAREEARRLTEELERWRHGVTVEGDFVCPDSLRATEAESSARRLREALERLASAADTECDGEFGGDRLDELRDAVDAARAALGSSPGAPSSREGGDEG